MRKTNLATACVRGSLLEDRCARVRLYRGPDAACHAGSIRLGERRRALELPVSFDIVLADRDSRIGPEERYLGWGYGFKVARAMTEYGVSSDPLTTE